MLEIVASKIKSTEQQYIKKYIYYPIKSVNKIILV